MEFYLKQISTFVRGKWYMYKTEYLEPLPIKDVTNENKYFAEQVTQKVGQILQLNEQIHFIEENIKSFPDSYFEDGWSFDKLMNVVKAQCLSRSSYAISEKSLRTDYRQRDLDGSETFRIILAANEFIDFYSEEVAS